ncbi:MAG: TetR/AcrR family transcriptional regulator [Bacteroidota bacterium]
MSPRTSKQFEEIRRNSRSKILDAALELFATQGFHNTSISQIAKKAGVAKGLIYNYFGDDNMGGKDDLIHQIVYEKMAEGDDFMELLSQQADAKSKLKLIIEFSFDFIIQNPHQSKLMVGLSLQIDQFPDLMELVKSRYVNTLPLMESLLREIGLENPREEAITITAMLDGLGMQYIVVQDAMNIQSIKSFLIKKYCS